MERPAPKPDEDRAFPCASWGSVHRKANEGPRETQSRCLFAAPRARNVCRCPGPPARALPPPLLPPARPVPNLADLPAPATKYSRGTLAAQALTMGVRNLAHTPKACCSEASSHLGLKEDG